MQFISECYKTQEMCDEVVDICLFITADSVTERYKTQKISYKAVYNHPFMLKYCLDWYNTQQICDKTVDDFVPASNFFLVDLLHTMHIIFINEDSNNAAFCCGEMSILSVDLD